MSSLKSPHQRRTRFRPVRTVRIPEIPTLQEFLRDVVCMQHKYVNRQLKPDVRKLVFTAFTTDGLLKGASASMPGAAIESLVNAMRSARPRLRVIDGLTIRVHLKGCSFEQSIPCAIGQSLAEEHGSRLGVKIRYRC